MSLHWPKSLYSVTTGFFNFWATITLRTSAVVIGASGMLATGPAASTTGAAMGAGTGVVVLETGNSFCRGLRLILVLVVDLFCIFRMAKDDARSDHASKSQ